MTYKANLIKTISKFNKPLRIIKINLSLLKIIAMNNIIQNKTNNKRTIISIDNKITINYYLFSL